MRAEPVAFRMFLSSSLLEYDTLESLSEMRHPPHGEHRMRGSTVLASFAARAQVAGDGYRNPTVSTVGC